LDHNVSLFDCGVPILNDWLKRRALRNEASGVSRTYVITHSGDVIGYYTLASGGIARSEAPKALQRNAPDPIPVIILGRLAVDKRFQGRGLGTALLRDATLRTLAVSNAVGVKALLDHALDEEAKAFYIGQGFLESPINTMTLCLRLDELQTEFRATGNSIA
jgi:GNAT superfamily N-acetyltransferase